MSAAHAIAATVRLYDRLFTSENPGAADDYRADLNPTSLEVLDALLPRAERRRRAAGTRYQFERLGYFCVDPDSRPGRLVFNRTVTLKDTWARIERAEDNHLPWRRKEVVQIATYLPDPSPVSFL